jgi:hypothetical protein
VQAGCRAECTPPNIAPRRTVARRPRRRGEDDIANPAVAAITANRCEAARRVQLSRAIRLAIVEPISDTRDSTVRRTSLLAAILTGLAVPIALSAQDSLAFAGLRWREVGPFRGGRSVAVTGNPSRPDEFWMGTTGGGVFKSINAGQSWAPVTDKYFGGTIGAV